MEIRPVPGTADITEGESVTHPAPPIKRRLRPQPPGGLCQALWLPGSAGDLGRDDIRGVPVEAPAGPVVPDRGPRVTVGGSLLNVGGYACAVANAGAAVRSAGRSRLVPGRARVHADLSE